MLWLAPFPPRLDGLHGGSRAVARLVDGLARRHDVVLLYLEDPDDEPVDDALVARCAVVESVPRLPTARTRAHWLLRHVATTAGLRLTGAPLGRRVACWAEAWRPDVVRADFHVTARFLPLVNARQSVRIYTEHDAGDVRGGRLVTAARRRYWNGVLRSADMAVVFTERDRGVLRHAGSRTPVEVVPLSMEVPARASDPAGSADRLLFVGNYEHAPNVDAAIRLARDILPRVRAHRPGAHLQIVGAGPPAALCALAGAGIEVTGRVGDLGPYMDHAAVIVTPLRGGGGMRVKVLEALAAGKAVVTTPLGAEGLGPAARGRFLEAESDAEFATGIVALLTDEPRRIALAGAARAWALEHLGTEGWVLAHDALQERLLASRRSAQAGRRTVQR